MPVQGQEVTSAQLAPQAADEEMRNASSEAAQWWLSFCDPSRPAGQQFLGVLIIDAPDLASAMTISWAQGLNPGGQVQVAGPLPGKLVDPKWCHRLLTREEAKMIPPPR